MRDRVRPAPPRNGILAQSFELRVARECGSQVAGTAAYQDENVRGRAGISRGPEAVDSLPSGFFPYGSNHGTYRDSLRENAT